jgi:lipopolysaccharide/colanic/teichoic acid biosynthesis glycosyltransferase
LNNLGDSVAKRVFDFVCAALGLVILMPFFAVIALAIRLNSPGPVFFRGERVGMGGKPFRVFKFRTMVVGAAQQGPGITARGDARITRVGRFLRSYKIDELPQLFNVLRGEMSLVGPRPEDARYVAHYTAAQRRLLQVRPGITSPATLRYHHEERWLEGKDGETAYLDELMPRKLAIELEYLDTRAWSTDLRIILQTLLAIFR